MVSGYTIGTSTKSYSANCDAGFIGTLGSGGKVENLGVSGTIYASSNAVGGVVGYNGSGTVESSYNTGSVTGHRYVGGGVGDNCGTGAIVENSSNTGKVSGACFVGGVVGYNHSGKVEYSYNTGSVSGIGGVGGVVGCNSGTVDNTYFNISVSYGSGAIGGGTTSGTRIINNNGISQSDFAVTTWATACVLNLGPFNTWGSGSFNYPATLAPWYEGTVGAPGATITAPMLVPDLPTVTVTGNGSSVYSGSTVTNAYTATYTMGGTTLSPNVTVTTAVGPNAGTCTNTPSYSITAPPTQTSVDSVNVVPGKWTITALPVTATANAATMTYGGSVPSLSGTLTTTGPTGGLANLSATWTTPATSSSNAGSYAVNPSYSYLNGAVAGDFSITPAASNATALTINPATSTTGGGSSGSSGTGSSGSSTAGGITTSTFTPVLQTVDLYQKLPSLTGNSSPGNSSNSGSSSPSPSGNSTTLLVTPDSSLTVIQPFEDDTMGDGILSVQELKQ